MTTSVEPPPTPGELHLSLCEGVLNTLAPAERILASAAVDKYRRAPGRYREDPTRLAASGGGDLGGAGIDEMAQHVLPYVAVLSGMGLQVVLQAAQEEATEAAVGRVRRWWKQRKRRPLPPAFAGPLTEVQLEELGRLIDKYGAQWQLPEPEVIRLRVALLEQFVSQFGHPED
ncbi:hypothetical protein ACOZ38_13750 [Sphaerisporangium viridialbum]|uniref:hypothetical protein n=1 Tax=Sphaerisporangium viridialbum TaxID=46189 RepID=UPI003C725E89